MRQNRLFGTLALGAFLGFGACAENIDQPVSDEQIGGTLAAPTPVEFAVLYEFEGFINGETGEMTIDRVSIPDNSPVADDPDGLRTTEQAIWCRSRVVADTVAGSNPPESIELYTDTASITQSVAPAIGSFCYSGGGSTGLYAVLGVFCANVRVMNFFAAPLTDVHVAIDFVGDAANFGPYGSGLGTSVVAPAGLSAGLIGLPAIDAVWSYGTLAPTGTGNNATRLWSFRWASNSGNFRFIGRVVSRISENCGNAIDDDCDGIVNNGCGVFATGAACIANNDCSSNFCNAGFCSSNACGDTIQNGSETDIDCGGSLCGATCTVGDTCAVNGDCASGVCRSVSGTLTCQQYANPPVGGLVISEFMAQPALSTHEWFEVYNPTSTTWDLQSCVLHDRSPSGTDQTWTLPSTNIVVAPGAYHVLAATTGNNATTSLSPSQFTIFTRSGYALAVPTDYMEIRCGGVLIDRVDYDEAVLDITEADYSAQLDVRRLTSTDNENDRNFCRMASPTRYNVGGTAQYGTPGAANSQCTDYTVGWCNVQHPTARPEPAYATFPITFYGRVFIAGLTDLSTANNANIRVTSRLGFGPVGTAPGSSGWNMATDMVPNPSWVPLSGVFPDVNNDEYFGSIVPAGVAGDAYDVAVQFSGDGGNSWTSCDIDGNDLGGGGSNGFQVANAGQLQIQATPPAPSAGEVIFTEVLIDGYATPEEEWFELYNRAGAPRSLAGCVVRESVPAQVDHTIQWTGSSSMANGASATVAAQDATPGFTITGRAPLLSVNDDGESLTLICAGTVVDRVTFGGLEEEAWKSLQLDPSRYFATSGNDATSGTDLTWWCSPPDRLAYRYYLSLYGTPNTINPSCLPITSCALNAPSSFTNLRLNTSLTPRGQFESDPYTYISSSGDSVHHMLRAEVGIANASTDPSTDPSWTWSSALPFGGPPGTGTLSTNDGFFYSTTAPSTADTTRYYAYRFSGQNGAAGSWTYCDNNGSANGYQTARAGVVTTGPVYASGAITCNLQWPYPDINSAGGVAYAGDSRSVYARVRINGLTELTSGANAAANAVVQLGYGADGSARSTWTYVEAGTNAGFSDATYDEYLYALTIPTSVGAPYDYGYRVSGDGGSTWVDCADVGHLPVATWVPGWADDTSVATSFSAVPGGMINVTAQMWPNALSVPPAPGTDVWAEFGVGPDATTPLTHPAQWTWSRGSYSGPQGNDWTFASTATMPSAATYPTTFRGVWRFTGDGGQTYFYADRDSSSAGGSFNDMMPFTALAPTSGNLLLTEFNSNPVWRTDPDGEWFEVHNALPYPINLKNVFSADVGPGSFSVTTDLVIASSGYAAFAATSTSLMSTNSADLLPAPNYVYGTSLPINESGSTIRLRIDGIAVNSVTWTSAWTSNGESASLSQLSLDNTLASSWCDGGADIDGSFSDDGTPGQANPQCLVQSLGAGSLVISEVFHTASSGAAEWIELYNPNLFAIDFAATPIRFSDGTTTTGTVSAGLIAGGGYFVVANSSVSGFTPNSVVASWGTGEFLASASETLSVIRGADTTVIDAIVWSASYNPLAGRALNLDSDRLTASANGAASNWCNALSAYSGSDFGTPGSTNNPCTETCTGGVDDDLDGLIDCADLACSGVGTCVEPWINEVHYNNINSDTNEGFEVAGPQGVSLAGWTISHINGSSGAEIVTTSLFGTIPNLSGNAGAVFFAQIGLQDDNEGVALVRPDGSVAEFFCYEGAVTATAGPASGMTCSTSSFTEASSVASSTTIQRQGTGCSAASFTWSGSLAHTRNLINTAQTWTCP